MARHALWWHRCENWWNHGWICPISGNVPGRPEPEEDEPPGKTKKVPIKAPNLVPVPVLQEETELQPYISGPGISAVGIPIKVPIEVPAAAAQPGVAPSLAPQPATAPSTQSVRASKGATIWNGSLATVPVQVSSGVAGESLSPIQPRSLSTQQLRVGPYEAATSWQTISSRLDAESQSLSYRGGYAALTSAFASSYSNRNPPGGGAAAENLSSQIAEIALARH